MSSPTHPNWPTSTPTNPAERAVAMVNTLTEDQTRVILREVARYLAETEARVVAVPAANSAGRTTIEADAYRWILGTVLGTSNP
jgi:hypothetical protein